ELTAIIDHLPEARQTLLFSATVPPDIERMARNKLHDPELVILSGDQVGALQIEHFVYWVKRDKVGALVSLIDVEGPESAIVFCNTKDQTHLVAKALKARGHQAAWLNGDLAQNERERVMRDTREGRLRFLVATDVAARGIDISHLTHVINYDFPRDAEAYVHRTGRTGRAGRTGTALSLLTPQDIGALYILRLTYKIRPLERALPLAGELRTREETDIVLTLADAFVASGRSEAARALARRVLTHDNAEELVAGLLAMHLSKNPDLPAEAKARRRQRRGPTEKPTDKAKAAPKAPPRTADNAPVDKAKAAPKARHRAADKAPTDTPPATPAPAPTKTATPTKTAAPAAAATPRPRKRRSSRTTTADGASRPAAGNSDAGKPARRARTPRDAAEAAPAPAAGEHDDAADGVELHVNVGRRHGVRAAALKEILAGGGIDRDAVRRVRVRERYTFVEVSKEILDAALAVLNGASLGEHTIEAGVSSRSR
ncbi:MAG TPA: heavy metal transporter, partial [Sorangium sp.]|nr:heavy metal transporter [Sorangium sp.]